MCGRFVATSPPDVIAKYFGAEAVADSGTRGANYNVAPTTDVFVVYESGHLRRVEPMHWGLVPRWAKDPSIGNRMINARSETLAEKNSFKVAFRKRRCIVPADGFYEWKKVEGQRTKQPYFIHRPDDEPFAFAGLWEIWKDPNHPDTELHSTTVITTEANEPMSAVHDRMPVILPPSAWDEWLAEDDDDLATLGRLLVPAPPQLIAMHPVSTDVNNVRNKGAHLIDPIDPADPGASSGGS